MTDKELAVDEREDAGTPEEELSDDDKQMAKLKEAITVKREEVGALRVKLTVTVPRDTVDERMGEEFAELKREANIPGFRKGRAPLRLVEKRFAQDVGDQLIGQLVSRGYLGAVEKEDLKPLGDPLVWAPVTETRTDDDGVEREVEVDKLLPLEQALEHLKLPKEGPLTFACELELKPEFELPSLDKIPVEKTAIGVSDDDVDAHLRRMRMSRGTFMPVESGPVEEDDMLYVDAKMTVDDQVLLSEENYDLAARDMVIKGVRLEGLGDALVGKKRDDCATFETTVPDDHENADIRGKTAKFEFAIREIKRLNVPPIDDEFLQSVGHENEKDLRETLRTMLESQIDQAVQSRMRDQIGEYLVNKTTLDIPEGLSQRQTERSVARRMIEMYREGFSEAEIEKERDNLQVHAHEQTVSDLKLHFILDKIAEERDIDVAEEHINSAIAQIAQRTNKRFDRVRDELSKGDGLMSLYRQLRDQEVLSALLRDAEITEIEGPKKSTAKKSPKKASKTTKKKAVAKASRKKTVKKADDSA